MAPTSYPMALASLILLPFDIISTILRFRIRAQRKAWGADDWAMLVNIPFWLVSTVATLGMAWSGVGAYDATLSAEQKANSMLWFYVFQEPWCFTLITIKWSIGFALIRIANGMKWIEYVIYTCLAVTLVVMGGTGMYLFFQCMPIEKNWHTAVPGTCQDRSIQTVLSYAVAAVSISTDWVFAILPIFLLWNIQLDPRVKASVVGLLGLGIFASIAPIVRLKFLIGMNDQSRFLQNLSSILAWATAEMNVGMLVANLPACRPLLERAIHRFSSWTGSASRSLPHSGKPGATAGTGRNYLELDERPESKNLKSYLSSHGTKGGPGIETRIYGREFDADSSLSLDRDEGSQKHMVGKSSLGGMQVNVQRDFTMEVNDGNHDGVMEGQAISKTHGIV
ncbi:hypothetical protein P153DRAFT_349541 [Dothidotthia symphoricarpi CBS 119687]|uniref:Rhodopsin domain-containing protein n=1 Tax=Dothidotthia symphoricarpi CBS 119687 TaxID=1392245 RepID=A0A6A6A2Q0_9PLEO|nr:uncharacterized protein P153DRAFT_349541 [Dothidotthia symphoricarpi CBS 119687]KAF2125177.1 hypothetical protein P153DRAFT_349541 [Dothidotthia symphoricarpi CBS 119687]